jgi:hypothetical protein
MNETESFLPKEDRSFENLGVFTVIGVLFLILVVEPPLLWLGKIFKKR